MRPACDILPTVMLLVGALAVAGSLPGCSGDADPAAAAKKAALAEGCYLDGDCTAPLVCAFQRCHQQCTAGRDCEAGASCVAGGVCQLADERACARNSDCPGKLTCGPDDRCRDECKETRDCTGTAVCVTGVCAEPSEVSNGRLAGAGPGTQGASCGSSAECASPLVCVGGVCRAECNAAVDCGEGEVCIDHVCKVAAGTPPACTPGAQVACACPGGSTGVAVCDAKGTALGPCNGCGGSAGAAGQGGAAGAAGVAGGSGASGGGGAGNAGAAGASGAGMGGAAGAAGMAGMAGAAGCTATCGNGVVECNEPCDVGSSAVVTCGDADPYVVGQAFCLPDCTIDQGLCVPYAKLQKAPVKGAIDNVALSGTTLAFDGTDDTTDELTPDTNGFADVFVMTFSTGATPQSIPLKPLRISKPPGGESDGDSGVIRVSPDGTRVLFWSAATNLVPGLTGGVNLYAWNGADGSLEVVDATVGGAPAFGTYDPVSEAAAFRPDGKAVYFFSSADELPGGGDGRFRLYLRDLVAKTTTLVSLVHADAPFINGPRRIGVSSNGKLLFQVTPNGGGFPVVRLVDAAGGSIQDLAANLVLGVGGTTAYTFTELGQLETVRDLVTGAAFELGVPHGEGPPPDVDGPPGFRGMSDDGLFFVGIGGEAGADAALLDFGQATAKLLTLDPLGHPDLDMAHRVAVTTVNGKAVVVIASHSKTAAPGVTATPFPLFLSFP